MRLEMRRRHLLVRIERALHHSTGLDVLDLCTDERGTLSRFHVLKINNLPDTPIVLNGQACAEIGAVNHIVRSSISVIPLHIIAGLYTYFNKFFWRVRQRLRSVMRDEHRVLDADSAPARNIDSRLIGNQHILL